MSAADLKQLPGFQKSSNLADVDWYWAPPLDGRPWIPFFKAGRLQTVIFTNSDDLKGLRKMGIDSMLSDMLGPPHKTSPATKPGDRSWAANELTLIWEYEWGEVRSTVELRDYTPEFQVHWKI